MKQWWIAACVVVSLSACGGGGDGVASDEQTPFEFVVSESRAQPLEQSCRASADGTAPPVSEPLPLTPEPPVQPTAAGTGSAFSVLEVTEARAAASGKTVEVLERESFHDTTDCSGTALVSSQVQANGQQVPVARITYLNTLRSAQVRRLDGSTVTTLVDRVEVAVNPNSGAYEFAFLSPTVAGSQQKQGFTTTATFTLNGVTTTQTHELEAPATAVVGLARLNGEIVNLLPVSDGVFQEMTD